MPIHLDEDAAEAAGLPGIIAHGFCVLAFTSWGILEGLGVEDPARLKRLAARFARPVLPGQEIETRAWAIGSESGSSSFAFETAVGDTLVIRDGLAEFSA